MDKRKASFLINFSEVKRKKQKTYTQDAEDLYKWVFQFLQSEMNMREKVRAKALFRDICHLPKDQKLSRTEEVHFEHWLLFDYITVIGSRPFDLFVRAHQAEMSKSMVETAGLFMLMYLAPYRVLDADGDHFLLTPLHEEKEYAVSSLSASQHVDKGSLVFARIAAVGFEKMGVGPFIIIPAAFEDEVLSLLEQQRNKGIKSYHRFLKEMGISFLRYDSEKDA